MQVEETNTIVSVVLDMDEKRITTFMSFSHGHWARNDEAKGYKRDEGKLDKWRELSLDQPETWKRTQIPEQATIDKIYEGRGSLEDIDMSWPTVRRPLSPLSLGRPGITDVSPHSFEQFR